MRGGESMKWMKNLITDKYKRLTLQDKLAMIAIIIGAAELFVNIVK